MGTIFYDTHTGNLEKDRIWEMVHPDISGHMWADLVKWETKDVHGCPINKRHVTNVTTTKLRVDLLGSDKLADFVPCWQIGPPGIISEGFAVRLRSSKLTGFTIRPIVEVVVNQTHVKDPKLLHLQFSGKGGFLRRLKVKDAPNACPTCGQEPVVCPGCGKIQRDCLKCGKKTLFLPKAPEESVKNGFRLDGYPPDVWIAEAKEWDGSDWFESGGTCCVSNRAKEWLERTHTHPIDLKPALLNVEGVGKHSNPESSSRTPKKPALPH